MTGVIIFTLIHGIFIRRSFILDDWWGNYNKIYTWFNIESSLTKKYLYTNARNRGCTVTHTQKSKLYRNYGKPLLQGYRNCDITKKNHALSCKWEPENKCNSPTYISPRILSEVSVETWVSHYSHTTPYPDGITSIATTVTPVS